jgi:hypothetical protein
MRRLLSYVLTAVVAVGLASCQEDPVAENPVLTVEGELVAKTLDSKAQEFTLDVLANGEYKVSIDRDAELWLEEVEPAAATRALTASKITFAVTANNGLGKRTGIITLTRDDFSQEYTVVQDAASAAFVIDIANGPLKASSQQNPAGEWEVGSKEGGVPNTGMLVPLRIEPNANFDIEIDESTPWLSVQSGTGTQDVNISVASTYSIESEADPADYSNKRLGVVKIVSKDKLHSARVIIRQQPRVAGVYVLEEPEGGYTPKGPSTSLLGRQLLSEVDGFRSAITTLKITGPMTEFDWLALNFFDGAWCSDTLKNLAPLNLHTLDLSDATFETIPENVFNRFTNNKNLTITKIILPDGVKTISKGAFQYLAGLEEINIPSTVEYIGDAAFENDLTGEIGGHLKTISEFPRSLKYIGARAFRGHKLSNISFAEPEMESCTDNTSKLVISNQAFSVVEGSTSASTMGGSMTEDLIIPNWASYIGFQAFSGVFYQTPDSPTTGSITLQTPEIGATIKIGKNIEKIGYAAFAYNLGVTKFDFATGDKPLSISQNETGSSSIQYGLFAKTGISEFTWPISGREVTVYNHGTKVDESGATVDDWKALPEGVIAVPSYAFAGCTYLKNITIKNPVTLIGKCAFYSASPTAVIYGTGRVNLNELTLPTSLSEFGGYCFMGVSGVNYVNVIDETDKLVTESETLGLWDLSKTNLKTIGSQALYNMSYNIPAAEITGQKMTELRLPSTIRNFQGNAMNNNNGINGKPLYLPDGFAHDASGKPTNVTSGDYILNTSAFSGITPIYTYVPIASWGSINWEE